MSTMRIGKRTQWTTISKAVSNDERLSYRALGVLLWLLSKPDDWTVDSDTMHRGAGREGRDSVRTALRELETYGYLERSKCQDAKGRWINETIVREEPTLSKQLTTPADDGFPGVGSPGVGFPGVGSPGVIISTDTEVLIQKEKTHMPDSANQASKPLVDPGFAAFWKLYPRKEEKQNALREWKALTTEERELALERCRSHPGFVNRGTYTVYPGRWLKGKRWEDELTGSPNTTQRSREPGPVLYRG